MNSNDSLTTKNLQLVVYVETRSPVKLTQLERKVSKFDNSTLEACALALLLVLLNVAAASYATDANQMPVCLSECAALCGGRQSTGSLTPFGAQ